MRTANEIVAPSVDDAPLPDSVEGEIGALGRVTCKVQTSLTSAVFQLSDCQPANKLHGPRLRALAQVGQQYVIQSTAGTTAVDEDTILCTASPSLLPTACSDLIRNAAPSALSIDHVYFCRGPVGWIGACFEQFCLHQSFRGRSATVATAGRQACDRAGS